MLDGQGGATILNGAFSSQSRASLGPDFAPFKAVPVFLGDLIKSITDCTDGGPILNAANSFSVGSTARIEWTFIADSVQDAGNRPTFASHHKLRCQNQSRCAKTDLSLTIHRAVSVCRQG